MKSAHRQAARAKRQRVHAASTYGLLDTLFAAPDRPMPEARRTFQLTRTAADLPKPWPGSMRRAMRR